MSQTTTVAQRWGPRICIMSCFPGSSPLGWGHRRAVTAASTGPILFLHQFYNTNIKEAFTSPHLFWSLTKGNVRDTITVWGVGVDSPGQTHTHWVTGTLFRHELLQQGWGSGFES